MKTALDLPDDLVREVKLIAIHRGKKLKDMFADLIRRGIDSDNTQALEKATIGRDAATGLPVVICHSAPRNEVPPDRIAEILVEQETGWALDAARR